MLAFNTTWTTTTGLNAPVPLLLDDQLRTEFLAASTEKGNSPGWLSRQRRLLVWWQEVLAGRDLRALTLLDFRSAIHNVPGRRHRVEVIKSMMSWLRSEGRLTRAEDASMDLRIPPARPAQWTASKVVPATSLDAVQAILRQPWRDLLVLLCGTGWHLSEALRFTRRGQIDGSILLCPMHKSGDLHRTIVSDEVLEAATRLRRRGRLGIGNAYKALRQACTDAGVARFGYGRMRHTVASRAVEAGASMADVATFLGHRSPATTRRWYATLAVPAKVPTLR